MKLNVKTLADVEIGLPVLTPGVYHARLKAEVVANKAGTGNNLKVSAKILDNPVTLQKEGKEIQNKGQVLAFRHISLVPTDDYDPDKTLKELAVAIKLDPTADLNVEDLDGKTVNVKLSFEDESKDATSGKTYPPKNNIDRFTPIKDDDTFTVPPF